MARKSPKQKQDVSNEDLALMIGRGFASVDERFKEVIKEVDKRFEKIEQRIDGLSNRIDDILVTKATRDEVRALDRRLELVENKLGL